MYDSLGDFPTPTSPELLYLHEGSHRANTALRPPSSKLFKVVFMFDGRKEKAATHFKDIQRKAHIAMIYYKVPFSKLLVGQKAFLLSHYSVLEALISCTAAINRSLSHYMASAALLFGFLFLFPVSWKNLHVIFIHDFCIKSLFLASLMNIV